MTDKDTTETDEGGSKEEEYLTKREAEHLIDKKLRDFERRLTGQK